MSDETLKDKVVIVTGGASGIGRASAILFAEHGAKVVVADRNEESGKKVVEEIRRIGNEAIFVMTDVSKAVDARKCVKSAVDTYGRLDCLFSNAGINPLGTVEDTSEELWDEVMDVNLKGMFLLCKYSIPEMKKAGKGSIVCTSSTDGILALPNEAAYIASKGGIISLVKAMACDYAKDNIRVNCICPGPVRTALTERHPDDDSGMEDVYVHNPMRRVAEPEEIASVAMFLLSDTPTFVTGSTVAVDGGHTAAKL